MRTRNWLVGLLLAGLCVASAPAPAKAAMWPFSLFGAKKAPAKKAKSKAAKHAYGNRIKATKPVY
jgi:hypothetical protein